LCVANCRKVLHEAEAERKLIQLVGPDKSVAVQQSAVLALAVMAQSDASRDAIRKHGTSSFIHSCITLFATWNHAVPGGP